MRKSLLVVVILFIAIAPLSNAECWPSMDFFDVGSIWSRLENGMTRSEIIQKFGTPDSDDGTYLIYENHPAVDCTIEFFLVDNVQGIENLTGEKVLRFASVKFAHRKDMEITIDDRYASFCASLERYYGMQSTPQETEYMDDGNTVLMAGAEWNIVEGSYAERLRTVVFMLSEHHRDGPQLIVEGNLFAPNKQSFRIISTASNVSDLPYTELVSLRDQLNLAIWNSKDWKEVTVPQGIWEVGKDIPVGHWTIKAARNAASLVVWCEKLNEKKTYYDSSSIIGSSMLVSPVRSTYDANDDKVMVDWELTDGTFIVIDSGSSTFAPYEGKPAFTFD